LDLIIGIFKFEALRRVHLIPSENTPEEAVEVINANMFRNLDSPVSEGGENFSTGWVTSSHLCGPGLTPMNCSEKQLLCMSRAILKRSKVLVMDEVRPTVLRRCQGLDSIVIRQLQGK
jgi:hypothetical protein